MDGGGRDGRGNRPAAVRDPAAYIRLPSLEIEAGKAQDRNAALAVVAGRGRSRQPGYRIPIWYRLQYINRYKVRPLWRASAKPYWRAARDRCGTRDKKQRRVVIEFGRPRRWVPTEKRKTVWLRADLPPIVTQLIHHLRG